MQVICGQGNIGTVVKANPDDPHVIAFVTVINMKQYDLSAVRKSSRRLSASLVVGSANESRHFAVVHDRSRWSFKLSHRARGAL